MTPASSGSSPQPGKSGLAQTLPDLVQHALTMYRVHEGCQMVRAFPVE